MKTEQQTAKRPDRRLFLKTSATAAAGLSLAFYLPGRSDASNTPRLNAWVEVLPNETVVIRYARTEMGQGSRTSAPQLVAEELDADWSRVRVEYVPDDKPTIQEAVLALKGRVGASGSLRRVALLLRLLRLRLLRLRPPALQLWRNAHAH
jgi:CO/xanthine dehydrogenase Mo-binding subunit